MLSYLATDATHYTLCLLLDHLQSSFQRGFRAAVVAFRAAARVWKHSWLAELLGRTPVKGACERVRGESAAGPQARRAEEEHAVQHSAAVTDVAPRLTAFFCARDLDLSSPRPFQVCGGCYCAPKWEKGSVAAPRTASWPALRIKMKNLPAADSVCLARRAAAHCG